MQPENANDIAEAEDIILISSISVTAKTDPHPVVLTGKVGSLDETTEAEHVFVRKEGSRRENGGPTEGKIYKLHFIVAGGKETIQHMTYVGYAANHNRFVFSKAL